MEEVEADTVRMMQLWVELTELMWVDDVELLMEQTLQPTAQQQTPESRSPGSDCFSDAEPST